MHTLSPVVPNLRPQDHRQTFGEYCLDTAVTPEVKAILMADPVESLVISYSGLLYREDRVADLLSTAILEAVERRGLSEAFQHALNH